MSVKSEKNKDFSRDREERGFQSSGHKDGEDQFQSQAGIPRSRVVSEIELEFREDGILPTHTFCK